MDRLAIGEFIPPILKMKRYEFISLLVYIYMLPIAGQTAGQIGLKFVVDTQGWPRSVMGYKEFDFFSMFSLKKTFF